MLKTYVQIFIGSMFIIFLICLGMSTPNPNSTHNHNHNQNYDTVQRTKVDELVKLANDFDVTKLAMKIQKDGLITKDELEILRNKVKISIIQKYR